MVGLRELVLCSAGQAPAEDRGRRGQATYFVGAQLAQQFPGQMWRQLARMMTCLVGAQLLRE